MQTGKGKSLVFLVSLICSKTRPCQQFIVQVVIPSVTMEEASTSRITSHMMSCARTEYILGAWSQVALPKRDPLCHRLTLTVPEYYNAAMCWVLATLRHLLRSEGERSIYRLHPVPCGFSLLDEIIFMVTPRGGSQLTRRLTQHINREESHTHTMSTRVET